MDWKPFITEGGKEDYSRKEFKNKFLVVIDPGHGGPDPGAIGIGGIRETDVVLKVSKIVKNLLSEKGVKVRLTRTNDVDLDLPPRVSIANNTNAGWLRSK